MICSTWQTAAPTWSGTAAFPFRYTSCVASYLFVRKALVMLSNSTCMKYWWDTPCATAREPALKVQDFCRFYNSAPLPQDGRLRACAVESVGAEMRALHVEGPKTKSKQQAAGLSKAREAAHALAQQAHARDKLLSVLGCLRSRAAVLMHSSGLQLGCARFSVSIATVTGLAWTDSSMPSGS